MATTPTNYVKSSKKKTATSSSNSTTRSTEKLARRLAKHVTSICQEHGIAFEVSNRCQADLRANKIYFRPVRSRITYAIALHEIGHLLSHSKSKPRLFQEGEAWEWAIQNALEWTPAMQRTMVRGLLTYLDEAYAQYKFCLPKPLKLPPASHFFWKPLRRYPQARYLLKRAPAWLNKSLPTVPWGDVLAHEDRPRCTNCEFWRQIETCSVGSETPEKLSWGECCHKKRPLGTEMTPGGALCGTSWMRRD